MEGLTGDCPELALPTRPTPRRVPASNPYRQEQTEETRVGRVERMRKGFRSELPEPGYCPIALDYQWPSNAHRVFAKRKERGYASDAPLLEGMYFRIFHCVVDGWVCSNVHKPGAVKSGPAGHAGFDGRAALRCGAAAGFERAADS